MNTASTSIGMVKYHDLLLTSPEGFKLKYGGWLPEINVRYETYGNLNATRTNAILVVHSLTGNHHAAGKYHASDPYPGWWDAMIGPGKALDTQKYFVICSNNLGGCDGSTGPNSSNPRTQAPYALDFPVISISDMVTVQYCLMEQLHIPYFHTIVGASMGGMMALEWGVHYPQYVKNVIAIATTSAQGPQSIALSEVGRQAIMRDPAWKNGNYFKRTPTKHEPLQGLAVARMLAHITYLSPASMERKFGRKYKNTYSANFTATPQFQVENYLQHQGNRFIDRFDPNSYLYITKALNYFDLGEDFPSLDAAFTNSKARYLFVSFSSDWIYPQELSFELMKATLSAKQRTHYFEIVTDKGHDAFLLEHQALTQLVNSFLTPPPLPPASPSTAATQHGGNEHSLHSPSVTNEFTLIAKHIQTGSRILDLGCGDGTLLQFLQKEKNITPYGIERDHKKSLLAIQRGLNILQGHIENILPTLDENTFDTVILSRTIQQLENPTAIIDHMLRIGQHIIISFLNQAYFRNRINFLLQGNKFRSTVFPHDWHDNPDIHLLSIRDFEAFLAQRQYKVTQRTFLKGDWLRKTTYFPNLLAGVAIYVITVP